MSVDGKEYKLMVRIAGMIDKSFNTSLATANTALSAQVTKLNNTFTKMDKYGNAAFSALTKSATVAAVAVGAIEAASVKVGAEFEAQMSSVQAIAQASSDELGQLSDKARELAQETVFSATEAGKAMEYMGLAGWDTTQMLDGIEGVLNLAAASGEDLAEISDIVTDDLTAFNMTAEETQRMVDVMAQTAMNSNTTVGMMGEAFKYAGSVAGTMGYSIEDLGIAIGTIASQGIKSSMAGTALRNMITRMVKPTKESQEAIEALGLSLYDSEGNMNSFLDIMLQLRAGMQQYNEAERNYYAAELGGQRGMAAIAAIANSSEESFNKLTEAIYHSTGAAEEMAKVRLDNLKGDAIIFKDALQELGIELYEQQSGPLRDVVQMGTKILQGLQKNMPAIGRSASKYIMPVAEGIMNFGSWTVKNGDNIISVFAGIASSILAFKAASTAVHGVNALLGILGSFGGPQVLALTAIVGLIGGIATKIHRMNVEAKEASLENHFGNLSLSLSEIKDIVDKMVHDASFTKVKYSLQEFEKLSSIGDNIEDTAMKLKKLNWKSEIGLGLTEDENESYKSDIEDFINNAQEYLTQAQFAASYSLADYFGEDSSEMQKVTAFFDRQRTSLTDKATELNEYITEAFSDGFLDIDEAQKAAELEQSISDILNRLSTDKLEAATALSKAKYGSLGDLDSDSFSALVDELSSSMDEYTEMQNEKFYQDYAWAKESGLSQSQLDDMTYQHLNDMALKQAEITNSLTDTLLDAYSDSRNNELVDMLKNGESVDLYDFEHLVDDTIMPQLETADMQAVGEMLEKMKPQAQQLESLAQSYRDAGKSIPQSVMDGLNEYYKLELMSGDTTHMWEYIASIIASDEDYQALLEEIEKNGENIPDGLAQAIKDNQDAIDTAVSSLYQYTLESLTNSFSQGFNVSAPTWVNATSLPTPSTSSNSEWLGVPYAMPDNNADGGIIRNTELSWLAEKGPEAVIPLDGSSNAMSLWEQSGRLLGMDSVLDGANVESAPAQQISYNPTLQFYGDAPKEEDITNALRISQDEFDAMMNQYLKGQRRTSFA